MPLNHKTSGQADSRVLVLMPAERPGAPTSDPSAPTREPAELVELRVQLAEALEDVAFLREQLRSTEAWSVYHAETLRARHRAARETFVRDLTLLIQGLDRHARLHGDLDDGERPPLLDAVIAGEAESMGSGR